jgi:hypothetical protein
MIQYSVERAHVDLDKLVLTIGDHPYVMTVKDAVAMAMCLCMTAADILAELEKRASDQASVG